MSLLRSPDVCGGDEEFLGARDNIRALAALLGSRTRRKLIIRLGYDPIDSHCSLFSPDHSFPDPFMPFWKCGLSRGASSRDLPPGVERLRCVPISFFMEQHAVRTLLRFLKVESTAVRRQQGGATYRVYAPKLL